MDGDVYIELLETHLRHAEDRVVWGEVPEARRQGAIDVLQDVLEAARALSKAEAP